MTTTYRVLIGLNYPPDDARAEVGDVLPGDFLPAKKVAHLVNIGVIEEVDDAQSSTESSTDEDHTESHDDDEQARTDASASTGGETE